MPFEAEKTALLNKIWAYYPDAHLDMISDAFDFAATSHMGQTRSSGDSYFTHCISVADILADKCMGCDVIITALLHDTVEDTSITLDVIESRYGQEVASLVAGVTKLKNLVYRHDAQKQAENFRKLLLAMSKDVRVLLVKLADRLHNIRTLHFISKSEKRIRIATETMDIYVPLADRIGIRDWKEELEDICFTNINPDAHESIVRRLDYLLMSHQDSIVTDIIDELSDLLKNNGIKHTISGRKKTPFSIWKKMQKKDVGFEQLSDIMAFRIITDSVKDCYHVLGVIHEHYRHVPGRYKDYISLPKENGYQSLHTGIIGLQKQRLEIQIRTEDMHKQAELGVAAHWLYKDGGVQAKELGENKQYRWIRGLLDILESTKESASDFLQDTRMEMYGDQIFVFSPKGDIVNLPKGACCIDFAYAIHSKIGDRMSGAKINGKMMPIKTVLRNGDQIEILTNKNAAPNVSWENSVVSGRARSAIRRYLRNKNRTEKVAQGQEMLLEAFHAFGKECGVKDVKMIADYFGYQSVDAYLMNVAEGTRGVHESLYVVYPEVRNKQVKPKKPIVSKAMHDPKARSTMIKGLIPGMNIRFPRCCYALPGDLIVGVIHTGQGVSVHKTNCRELKSYGGMQDNWIDISWDFEGQTEESFTARIHVIIVNKTGSLSSLTNAIASNNANLTDLQVQYKSEDVWGIDVEVAISTAESLMDLMAKIRTLENVTAVSR